MTARLLTIAAYAVGFTLIGSGVGLAAGVCVGEALRQPPGVTGMVSVPTCVLLGILGGCAAGFALGLLYAFVRRPAATREHDE